MQEKITKYGFMIQQEAIDINLNRLTNQLWKLIPMRENDENWKNHLASLIVEISGLGEIFCNSSAFVSLLSKLEGLLTHDSEFVIYRKIVFESISQLRGLIK